MKSGKETFYKAEQQFNNLHWHHLAYFKRKVDAEKYISSVKSSYPKRVKQCSFSTLKDFKNEEQDVVNN
tara:strand:+ start:505 stop:711 length:207 start_codon:yes stop_codon:yes gene_type:complete